MIFTILSNIGNILIITTTTILFTLYIYFKIQYKYWERKKVPHAKPTFPLGNLTGITEKSGYVIFKDLYNESKHQRYYGVWLLHKPVLLINDPDLIKKILIQNFDHFDGNGSYYDKNNNPFSENLFTFGGAKWKNLRAKLSPAFTSGKLKSAFPHLVKCSENLQEILQKPAQMEEVIDLKEITKRFTKEVIFSVFFGIECNFIKNENSDVGKMANDILKSTWINAIKHFCAIFLPDIAKIFKYNILSKELSDAFLKLLYDVVDFRQKNDVIRQDVMQSLIELLRKGYVDEVNSLKKETINTEREEFTFKDLASQAMMFLSAGFESSSTTIQFTLYELAMNPKIQKKLKKEINDILAKHKGKITYEAVLEMKYLDRVVDETLRKYSIASILPRKCAIEFKDPDSGLIIEKGTTVAIPIAGLHRDERYFPDPEKFDPDRFTEENKALIPDCAFLPFGKGPRFCIGQRFGQVQVKIGLIALLSKFQVDLPKEVTSNELKFDTKALVTAPRGKMMLKISLSKD